MENEALFNDLARELFALHFRFNAPYRRLCEARRVTPASVTRWQEIPSMPVSSYKELEVTCLPADERVTWFESSGTTVQRRSRNFHNSLSLRVYEKALLTWFQAQFASRPVPASMLALSPPPAQAPHSSLAHMFETIRKSLGVGSDVYCASAGADGGWVVDTTALRERLALSREPILILGPAFAYVHALESPGFQFQLPTGSVVFETGGYKGRSRVLPKQDLHKLICRGFGISDSQILCEYGMSELSSQAYEVTAKDGARVFRFPPWVRARLTSPETGQAVRDGQCGLIEVLDLANVVSTVAIQTEDLGVRHGDGFAFAGRATGAEARGCSLAPASCA